VTKKESRPKQLDPTENEWQKRSGQKRGKRPGIPDGSQGNIKKEAENPEIFLKSK